MDNDTAELDVAASLRSLAASLSIGAPPAAMAARSRKYRRRRRAGRVVISSLLAVGAILLGVQLGGGSSSRAQFELAGSTVQLPPTLQLHGDASYLPTPPPDSYYSCISSRGGIASFNPVFFNGGPQGRGVDGQLPGIWATSSSGAWLVMYEAPEPTDGPQGSSGTSVNGHSAFVWDTSSGSSALAIPLIQQSQILANFPGDLQTTYPTAAPALIDGQDQIDLVIEQGGLGSDVLPGVAAQLPVIVFDGPSGAATDPSTGNGSPVACPS